MFNCKPVQAFFILYFEQPTCFCWFGYSGVSDTNLAVHSDFNLTAIPIILSPTWSFFNVHFFQAKCTYIGLFLRISSTYFKLIVLISSELHLFRANYTHFKSTAPISSQFQFIQANCTIDFDYSKFPVTSFEQAKCTYFNVTAKVLRQLISMGQASCTFFKPITIIWSSLHHFKPMSNVSS